MQGACGVPAALVKRDILTLDQALGAPVALASLLMIDFAYVAKLHAMSYSSTSGEINRMEGGRGGEDSPHSSVCA
jgi:hypothetical protein